MSIMQDNANQHDGLHGSPVNDQEIAEREATAARQEQAVLAGERMVADICRKCGESKEPSRPNSRFCRSCDHGGQPATKIYYEITFVYTENGQQFGTGASMTARERTKLEEYLEEMQEAGLISDPQIFQYVKVDQDYEKVLLEIETALK